MHQLSDKIRAQEQAEAEQEGKDTEEQEAEQLAKETVVKHWGAKQRKAKAKIAALVGDEADAAAEQYEQRHIDGLKLLVVGSGEMVGELSLGVKEPELHEPEDPADAARKLVDAAKQRRLGHQNSRKRLERSESSSMNPQLKKVQCLKYLGSWDSLSHNHTVWNRHCAANCFRLTMWTLSKRSSQLGILQRLSPLKRAAC